MFSIIQDGKCHHAIVFWSKNKLQVPWDELNYDSAS